MDYAALRVAGYVRVSTEEQAIHGLSVDAQTAALHHWAEVHGAQLVKIYTDAGISGRKKAVKRPALTRLLEDVQADRLDLIIFTKLDRWFRNVGEYYKVQEVLEAHAVNWCTVQEEYDTASASGRLKINIMLSVAQDEADRTGERIKAVFARKRELGEVCGGRAPRGYRIENKRLVFDPEWKPAMELFFRSYFADWSAVAARNTVQAQTGKVISYQVARLLLRNEIYCGTLYGVPGACPAYITREQFAEIQKLKRRSTHRARTGRVYLFTGLLFCGECGGRLQVVCSHQRRKSGSVYTHVSYQCSRHANSDAFCTNRTCKTEQSLERYLLDHIEGELRCRVDALRLRAEEAPDVVALTGEKERLQRRRERLKDLYLDEELSLPEFRDARRELDRQLTELEDALAGRPALPDLSETQELLTGDWQRLYQDFTPVEKQHFWRRVLNSVTIDKDRAIHLSFSEKQD